MQAIRLEKNILAESHEPPGVIRAKLDEGCDVEPLPDETRLSLVCLDATRPKNSKEPLSVQPSERPKQYQRAASRPRPSLTAGLNKIHRISRDFKDNRGAALPHKRDPMDLCQWNTSTKYPRHIRLQCWAIDVSCNPLCHPEQIF